VGSKEFQLIFISSQERLKVLFFITTGHPAGKTYGTSQAVVQDFGSKAKELGANGISWWALEYTVRSTEMLNAVKYVNTLFSVGDDPQEPTPVPIELEKVANILVDHLTIRTSPELINSPEPGNKRGGLMSSLNDTLKVCGDSVYHDGISWIPVVVYIAEEYNGTKFVDIKEVIKK
jgi:hypothetical protein